MSHPATGQSNFERYGLSAEWKPDAQGIPYRRAARVAVIDEAGSILLVCGHDIDEKRHSFWFLPGGGIMPHENPRQAAVRELYEETGLRPREEDLVGPILFRYAQLFFLAVKCHQDEEVFLYRIPGVRPSTNQEGLTQVEKKTISDLQWFNEAEIRSLQLDKNNTVYPLDLPQYLASWKHGWDGSCPRISEGTKNWQTGELETW